MKRYSVKSAVVLLVGLATIALGTGCENQQTSYVEPARHHEPAPGYYEASYTATCGTGGETVAAREQANIVETAQQAGDFKTLLTAAKEAGLVNTLANEGPWTLFAPTDKAFEKLPEGTLDALLADKEQLRAVLLYHVVPGRVTSDQITGRIHARTAQGAALDIRPGHGTVMVGPNARVTMPDVHASNGVIHVIDRVLIPPK
jgi:uncharacterized surface protein with fasciclin (FAS1) repeats